MLLKFLGEINTDSDGEEMYNVIKIYISNKLCCFEFSIHHRFLGGKK